MRALRLWLKAWWHTLLVMRDRELVAKLTAPVDWSQTIPLPRPGVGPVSLGDVGELIAGDDELLEGVEPRDLELWADRNCIGTFDTLDAAVDVIAQMEMTDGSDPYAELILGWGCPGTDDWEEVAVTSEQFRALVAGRS